MRRVHRARCVWVVSGIEAKHKSDNFAPIRAFRSGIKQAQIGDEMRFIIVRDVFGQRRKVLEGRGLSHGQLGFDSLAFGLAFSTKSSATLIYAAYPQTGNAILQLRLTGHTTKADEFQSFSRNQHIPTFIQSILRG